jgi:hypothetical protein
MLLLAATAAASDVAADQQPAGDAPAIEPEQQQQQEAQPAVPATATARPRLLSAPRIHDLARLLDADLPPFDGAVGLDDLVARLAGGDIAAAAAPPLTVPAYANVLYLPRRLDCAAPTGEGGDADTSSPCARALAVVGRFLGGARADGDTPPPAVAVRRAVHVQLVYTADGRTPSTVPGKPLPPPPLPPQENPFLEEMPPADDAGAPLEPVPTPEPVVPRLGALVMLDAAIDDASEGDQEEELPLHRFTVAFGFAGEAYVSSHTLVRPGGVPTSAPGAVSVSADGTIATADSDDDSDDDGDGASAAEPWARALRVCAFNVWNSNPPRWLWRAPPDRVRQYALRLLHWGDVVRDVAPHILALQEVRYDSTLGGVDSPSGGGGHEGRFADGLATAADWYNKTRAWSTTARYIGRNERKWKAVAESAGYGDHAVGHPLEGPLHDDNGDNADATAASGAGRVDDVTDLVGRVAAATTPTPTSTPTESGDDTAVGDDDGAPAAPVRGNIYAQPRTVPAQSDVDAALASMAATPHAQIAHLAALLPGHRYFVHQPAQLYVDRPSYAREPSRDEEGPAIFSVFPIVHSDYLLLSRDAHDEGDGHQRLCLHAVVDVTEAVAAAGGGGGGSARRRRVLVDVYSVHLALSEAARNRTVHELRAFVRASARGDLQLLAGDMNAEPHEPALRALLAAAFSDEEHVGSSGDGGAATGGGADGSEAAGGAIGPTGRLLHLDHHSDGRAALRLADVWTAAHPEPVPRDRDAGVRRYSFTFPSDDPVKRIDMLLAGTPGGAPVCTDEGGVAGDDDDDDIHPRCVAVHRSYVVGQDPLPGTEGNEGRGLGMVHSYSPIYATDHRGLVAHVSLQQAGSPEAAGARRRQQRGGG